MTGKDKLINLLFETRALRVCPEDRPFWYTSGTIGPYYINTHFLYGGEEKAAKLLEKINALKKDVLSCPAGILELLKENYERDAIYRDLMDELCGYINDRLEPDELSCISGGERRDWFFSLLAAEMLDKPHLTIYKDLKTVLSVKGTATADVKLEGGRVLHIADLITEASSYERAWIPAVKKAGGSIARSLVVVDRKQGGERLLAGHGIESYAMVSVDESLFVKARELGHLNDSQLRLIKEYIKAPKASMKSFLEENPAFIKSVLRAGGKEAERARLCLEKDIYGLGLPQDGG